MARPRKPKPKKPKADPVICTPSGTRPLSRRLYVFYWVDAEASQSWGSDRGDCPVMASVGFIIEKPSAKQGPPRRRCWHLARDWGEEEPGSVLKIPVGMVEEIVEIGEIGMVYREPRL